MTASIVHRSHQDSGGDNVDAAASANLKSHCELVVSPGVTFRDL